MAAGAAAARCGRWIACRAACRVVGAKKQFHRTISWEKGDPADLLALAEARVRGRGAFGRQGSRSGGILSCGSHVSGCSVSEYSESVS